jgi:hypothetical protein
MNYFKDDKPNGSNRFVLKFGWQPVYGTPTLDQRHRVYRLKVTNLVKSGTSSKIYVHRFRITIVTLVSNLSMGNIFENDIIPKEIAKNKNRKE